VGCRPVIIKREKEQFLDWFCWGVESGAIHLPVESGPIQWPRVSLKDIFINGVQREAIIDSESLSLEASSLGGEHEHR
jgi:hypothetical protein